MQLVGTDFAGNAVTRTVTTAANGSYKFDNLNPGTYEVRQLNQPAQFRDGIDTLGRTFDSLGQQTAPNGQPGLDLNEFDERDADHFAGIILQGGFNALDYNFGELAVTVSKRDFVRPLFYE
jgi:hypothetical protein